MQDAVMVEGLSKVFKEIVALHDLSFVIGEGELFGILGPDSAGKTTLCRVLAGLKHFTGYMPHNYGLYGDLTVGENIDFYADIFKVPARERRERMDRILGFTGMAPFTKRRSQFLSGGMKQKLQLACALIHTPRFLFLDEPTYGVDPVSRREFWKLLLELLAGGLTILVSTSYMDEAQRCNRIALLHNGRVLHQGQPDDVIRRIPGIMLELFCSCTIDSIHLVENLPFVRKVTLYGDRLHNLLKENIESSDAIARLREGPIPAERIGIIKPSLEDSFIFLVEEAARNGRE